MTLQKIISLLYTKTNYNFSTVHKNESKMFSETGLGQVCPFFKKFSN